MALQRPKWRQIVIIRSTQCRTINNQTQENYYFVTLFPKRECILEIYFHWAHLNKKENLNFQPADSKSGKKNLVWHFGVDLLRQLDLQWWHCMHVHESIPKPHPCTPDERDSVLQWWSRCNHTFCMFLHEVYTNLTLQIQHSLPANHDSNGPLEHISGANAWLLYTK